MGDTTSKTTPIQPTVVFARAAALVAALLTVLAILSYTPEDANVLAGGLGEYAVVQNWVGVLGAQMSAALVLAFGFAAYPAAVLLLLCAGTRCFGRQVRPFRWLYLLGVLMVVCGAAMFLGIFPDLLGDVATRLNIRNLPGGVIGQRFCAPPEPGSPGGWLAFVVNKPGSAVIALAMMVSGLWTVWYYDWQLLWCGWWGTVKEELETRKEVSAKAAEERSAERERKEAERAEKRLREEAEREAEMARQAAAGAAEASAAAREPEAVEPVVSAPPVAVRKERAPAKRPELPESPADNLVGAAPAALTRPAAGATQPFVLPAMRLLTEQTGKSVGFDPREVDSKRAALQETLDSFNVDAEVGDATCGPRVTLFEIKPAPGVRVEKISSLGNNIAMNLKAESLRILTPIPGRDSVGIEVPNSQARIVRLRELFETPQWQKAKAAIPVALGKNISGDPVILDLARAPHLLIAGATGSGKSVCMNTLILSLLYRFSPEELRLIMVDPKVVEFSGYNTLPHLVTPVVTDVKKVPIALRWALNQMEWRYQILSKAGVRNIASYNSRSPQAEPVLDDDGEPIPDRLPYLVVIIDELADIMMTSKADVETSLARIAQLARAVGIHAVIATQRPSVNVITGVIKANFPTRIAFQVSSFTDSKTILDTKGAEKLLGRGDMLFKPPGGSKLERTQGAMVEDDEIARVVDFVSAQAEPDFFDDVFVTAEEVDGTDGGGGASGGGPPAGGGGGRRGTSGGGEPVNSGDGDEELIRRAIQVILQDRRATTSHVQRRLRIGYNRAALIIEELEQRGVIGPQIGTAPREILIVAAEGCDGDGEDDQDATEDDGE